MRELQYGAEVQSLSGRGWTGSGASMPSTTNAIRRQASTGFGGSRSLSVPAGGQAQGPDFDQALVEGWARFAVYFGANPDHWEIILHNGGNEVVGIKLNGTARVELRVATTLQDTSTEVLASGTWYVLNVHWRILSAGGVVEVFLDDDLDTPIASFSGDTDPSAYGDVEGIIFDGDYGYYDDIAVNSITMQYDGGTGGAPAAGETLTGGTSGATATIYAVDGDAASGRLYLRSVSGTFQDNEAVTSSGTFDALVNAPTAQTDTAGLENNSGPLSPHGYCVLLAPDGAGAHTECTPSVGPANWEDVDDWNSGAASDADYVEAGAVGNRDFYTLESLSTDATGIAAVEVLSRAKKQGTTINDIELGVRVNGTDYYDDPQALGTSFADHNRIWNVNPDDSERWETDDLTTAQAGFRAQS